MKLMWMPNGIVDCDTISEKDFTFDNFSNLCHTNRAWAANSDKIWPVTNHCYLTSLICTHLLRNEHLSKDEKQKAIIYSMYHDIEETFTTDIPHPFKHKEIKTLSDDIRDSILGFLNLEYTETTKNIVNLCDILSLYWEVKNEGKKWIDFSADGILNSRLKKCVAGVLKEGVSSNSILETLIWLKLVKKPSRNVVVRGEKALCEKYNDEMLENVIEHLM